MTNKFQISLRDFAWINLGNFIMAFAMVNIHIPARISEGGVMGLALVFYQLNGFNPATVNLVLDLSLYFIGFLCLSRAFLPKAILTTVSYSIIYSLCYKLGPILPSLQDAPLFAAIIGGILVGLGCGLVVSRGCVAGGEDCLALINVKYNHLSLSMAYFISDFIVLALSFVVYMPFTNVLISLVTTFISSFIIGQFELKLPQTNFKPVSFS
ncbi:YitT family protein [Eremococcus coleocola]|uniref:YitT family protein n=1 Tax=Eremococcus coleocola TaxID=88132 RepID=UPI000558743E|nr:YitT family protein [Eremococcus coleocola]